MRATHGHHFYHFDFMNNATGLFTRGRRYIRHLSRSLFPEARVDRITSLAQLKARIGRIQLPEEAGTIRGHLSPDEQRALYALGALAGSPMLEIGAWLGLSTYCLAKGVFASSTPKEFITCELNPTLKNFRELPDGRVAFYYPPESETTMGICSRELFENEIKPVVSHPDGILGQLRANLHRCGVDSLVQIITGDFRSELPVRSFRFIFADTMHEPSEIRRNAPDMRKYVTDGTILACHDTSPENRTEISRYFQFTESIQVDTLFIGVVKL